MDHGGWEDRPGVISPKTEHPAERNHRMENPKVRIPLLDPVRKNTRTDKHSLRQAARTTVETVLREYGAPNWVSFLMRHVFLFAEYRFPRTVKEHMLHCDTF